MSRRKRVSAVYCCCEHHPLELALYFYIFIKFEELRNTSDSLRTIVSEAELPIQNLLFRTIGGYIF